MQANYDHEQLIDFLEGDLPPEKMAQVDAMMAADPKLRALLEGMKTDRAALRAMPMDDAPPVVANVMSGLERRMLLGDPAEGEGLDAVAEDARRQRMRIGPKLLKAVAYTGVAAAFAVVGGVAIMTLSGTPLWEEADPERWAHHSENEKLADKDSDRLAGERLALAELDKGKSGPADALARDESAETFSKAVEAGKGGVFEKGASDAKMAMNEPRLSKGGWAEGDGVVSKDGRSLERSAEGLRNTRLNAARVPGSQGRFALSLPEDNESNVRIEVVSDNAGETAAALTKWLAVNDAQIVPVSDELGFASGLELVPAEELSRSVTNDTLPGHAGSKQDERERTAYAQTQQYQNSPRLAYCVVIEDEQVPALLAHMNSDRGGRQVARLVEPVQTQRVSLREEELYRQADILDQSLAQRGEANDTDNNANERVAMEQANEDDASDTARELTLSDDEAKRTDTEKQLAQGKLPADPRRESAPPQPTPEPEPVEETPMQRLAAQEKKAKQGEPATDTAVPDAEPQPTRLAKAEADDVDQSTGQTVLPEALEDSAVRGVVGGQPQESPAPVASKSSPPAASDPATERAAAANTVNQQRRDTPDADAGVAPNELALDNEAPDELEQQRVQQRQQLAAVQQEDVAFESGLAGHAWKDTPQRAEPMNWGAVLGNQLPLGGNTPIVLASRGRVVLPLVITEAPALGAESTLRLDPRNAEPNAPMDAEIGK